MTVIRFATTCALLLAALAVAACGGDSKAEAAQNTVCDARADISKQVDQLKGLTPATFTTEAASKSLNAIRSDLKDIAGAREDLSDDRRQEVEQANQQFAGQVSDIVKQVFRSSTAADSKTQLTSAFQQLADTYQKSYARIDCS